MSIRYEALPTEIPPCPVFGECGGCFYQHIRYDEELNIKQAFVERLFVDASLDLTSANVHSIVASPQVYGYRNRMDLKLLKTKAQEIFIGFSPRQRYRVIPVEACYIAREEISAFIPHLKNEVVEKLTPKYRNANLVVRCGDEGKVYWGGIGKRSCRLPEEDYLWTDLHLQNSRAERLTRRIFYSLDTFFQANLFILPKLFEVIRSFSFWGQDVSFYDLYGGVGLFSLGLVDLVGDVVLIEENVSSLALAKYNKKYHQLKNWHIVEGRTEDCLAVSLQQNERAQKVAMIDPPRGGLSESAARQLSDRKEFSRLLYLSCNPETLVRDLRFFKQAGWQIRYLQAFDFFPRTRHVETLVVLSY